MTYEDIEKFALENEDLARAIAYFRCRSLSCNHCVFHITTGDECLSNCLSSILCAMINLHDIYDKED